MSEAAVGLSPRLASRPGADPAPASALRKCAVWLLRDPFVHFLLLGLVIFAGARLLQPATEERVITVRPERLAQIYAQQYGRYPGGTELRELIDRYVREEIYYREGLGLGLQQEDEIVRRRIVQKYEFLQQDTTLVAEPSRAALRAFFDAHQAAYATVDRISFTHVYFRGDDADDAVALARAERVRQQLQSSTAERAPQSGDAFPELYDYSQLGTAELRRLFGDYPIVTAALQAPIGEWSGPFRSGYGWHLLRVTARTEGETPPFAEVRDVVREDFIAAERERLAKETVASLQKKYSIEFGGAQ